jgi:hypothetical protein
MFARFALPSLLRFHLSTLFLIVNQILKCLYSICIAYLRVFGFDISRITENQAPPGSGLPTVSESTGREVFLIAFDRFRFRLGVN